MKGKEADSVLVDKGENRLVQECRKESHFSNSLAVLCIPIIMYFSSYAYSLTPQWPHLSLSIAPSTCSCQQVPLLLSSPFVCV